MSFEEPPFGQRGQFAAGIVREDRRADIEKVDAAVEPAGSGFSPPMCRTLGNDANDSVLAQKSVSICEVSLYSVLRRQMQRS